MKLIAMALIAVMAPGASWAPRPSHPALPWLFNLQDVVAVESDDRLATLQMGGYEETDPECGPGAIQGLGLRADISRVPGVETVLASYARGALVIGSEGQVLASTPGYPCAGTADGLEVLAVGRAFGQPTVVLAVTTGGRREQLTWIGLFRVGLHGRLEATFAGEVEQREDGIVRRGSVTILPGALLHQMPDGERILWTYDEAGGVYVPRSSLDPLAPSV